MDKELFGRADQMVAGWTNLEVEAIVIDYFGMLMSELRGEPVNKTDHRRRLMNSRVARTAGSIERKHQNISAILIELGLPYIAGYKPLRNYQRLLLDVVVDRLGSQHEVIETIQSSVGRPASVPNLQDILTMLETPPKSIHRTKKSTLHARQIQNVRVDYLAMEARNSSLGDAGEQFVIQYEKARLIHEGQAKLADRIEHVSKTEGNGAGFDIRSFEVHGKDRLIEVKTTAYGKETPFYVTKGELQASIVNATQYHLFRLFLFRSSPKLFTISGRLDKLCSLDPIQYVARVA